LCTPKGWPVQVRVRDSMATMLQSMPPPGTR